MLVNISNKSLPERSKKVKIVSLATSATQGASNSTKKNLIIKNVMSVGNSNHHLA